MNKFIIYYSQYFKAKIDIGIYLVKNTIATFSWCPMLKFLKYSSGVMVLFGDLRIEITNIRDEIINDRGISLEIGTCNVYYVKISMVCVLK